MAAQDINITTKQTLILVKARKRNLPNTLTSEEWQKCLENFNHCCAICGRAAHPDEKLIIAMDHFIPLHHVQRQLQESKKSKKVVK